MPNLLEALNCGWEFTLYDTDHVLSESNEIQLQKERQN